MQVENVSIYVNKSLEVDSPLVVSSDVSTTADPDPIYVLKFCDEIKGSTLFL